MYKYGDHHVPACTKAALTGRGTPKHAHVCRLYYIYIYIYIYKSQIACSKSIRMAYSLRALNIITDRAV